MGALAFALATAVLVFTVAYFVLVERLVRPLRRCGRRAARSTTAPSGGTNASGSCPPTPISAFNGTPFKNVLWRLLGVRIGRRVFDDGAVCPSGRSSPIGDDCTLNAGSVIQCHSQEDGAFKSDRIAIGAGCTLGVGAFVHYGVTMGDGAVLAADSFLMKGEEVPPHARWGGNPAKEMRERSATCRSGGSHRRHRAAVLVRGG